MWCAIRKVATDTIWPTERSTSRDTWRTGALLALAALLGQSWRWGHLGPVLSPGLVGLVGAAAQRWQRFGIALVYFLAGSSGLPAGAATFFGPGHRILGDVLWIASAALLALPWIGATGAFGTLTALLFDAVPPLGCFGWLSPLTAAGVCYPHLGLAGLALLLTLFAAIAAWNRPMTVVLLIIAAAANLAVESQGASPAPPAGWVGVDTHIGPLTGDLLKTVQQRGAWLASVRTQVRQAQIVVLPETIAGPWWPGTATEIRAAIPPDQLWLVGATVWMHGHRADALMEVSARRTPATVLFVSPFPVPVSMWHPWARGSYLATGWEGVHSVHGVRVWAALCYDQLLPWVWIEGLAQSPQLVVAASNDWWARGTGVSRIQRATTWAWTRLMDAAAVAAENH